MLGIENNQYVVVQSHLFKIGQKHLFIKSYRKVAFFVASATYGRRAMNLAKCLSRSDKSKSKKFHNVATNFKGAHYGKLLKSQTTIQQQQNIH